VRTEVEGFIVKRDLLTGMAARNTSRRYVRPTESEFDDFIYGKVPSAEAVDEPGATEKVYELPLPDDDLSIRVYSTIQDGEARDHGADAIRCVIWSEEAGCPVGGRRKTLRIETWRDNLGRKIDELYVTWRDHDHGRCPDCGAPLAKRVPGQDDDWSPFLACTAWDGGDGCDFTEWL
jgi:hypothetical protein